ncbi:MAG: hypothetical protein IPI28_10720 [Candidatus Omnitrophica bacterium]|nr:hypothetical protein [Candidatus Omnitrophota bacterium]
MHLPCCCVGSIEFPGSILYRQLDYYWRSLGQIPDTVPTLEQYAVPQTYDSRHLYSVLQIWLNRINSRQNLDTDMAWGSSYQAQSLNDMYRGTGDRKYLDVNLEIIRATMANRDDKKGYATFFGETAPAWGLHITLEGIPFMLSIPG